MKRMFVFGLGYTASRIADAVALRGWDVVSTGRDGTLSFDDEGNVRAALADSDHVLSSVPPSGDGLDPVLERYGDAIAGKWLGYLSSTGVYGDTGGAWVDESAPVGTGRRTARAEADTAWQALGARVLRLPGIYGPGRSALDRLQAGPVARIDKPGHVFSRIHVDDIAAAVLASMHGGPPGLYNIADDLPAPGEAVTAAAARMLGQEPSPLVPLDQAVLSPMGRAFYAECRRVANGRMKRQLGVRLLYPDYHAGLQACYKEMHP